MPIYGYRCVTCGHEVEVLQSMSDAPLTVCEVCGGRLEKKLYPVGVQFKGSGFYSTDYKRPTSPTAGDGKPEVKPVAKSEGATSGGTETKAKSEGAATEKAKSGEGAGSKAAES